MSDLSEFEDNVLEDRKPKMRSLNYSMVQGQINGLLFSDKRFQIMPELTLDVSSLDLSQFGLKTKKELIPDMSLPKGPFKKKRAGFAQGVRNSVARYRSYFTNPR